MKPWIFFLLFLLANTTGFAGEPFVDTAAYFAVQVNSATEIRLQWECEAPLEKDRIEIPLFVPGPIHSATWSIQSFQWQTRDTNQKIQSSGNQDDFDAEAHRFTPQLQLRKLGKLQGCRLVSLSVPLLNRQYSSGAEEPYQVFLPKGQIQMRFNRPDPNPFECFPRDIQPVAEKLILNYPPARKAKTEIAPVTIPAYLNTQSIKIRTTETGILKIPARRILEAFQSCQYIESLSLYRQHSPQPFLITGKNGQPKAQGRLQPTDWLYFHSPRSQSPYSTEMVFWLAQTPQGHKTAKRMEHSRPEKQEEPAYQKTLVLEEDHVFIEGHGKNDEQAKYWMWHDFVKDGTKTLSFSLPGGIQSPTAALTLRLGYQPDFLDIQADTLYAKLNGTILDCTFTQSADGLAAATGAISSALLKTASNELDLFFSHDASLAYSNHITYLDAVELSFACAPFPSQTPFQLLPGQKKISPPKQAAMTWLARTEKENQTQAYFTQAAHATLPSQADGDVYFLPANGPIACVTLESTRNKTERTFNPNDVHQTDVILISPRAWLPVLREYTQFLSQKGYTSRIVAVEDIYDVFGDGRLNPHAIKDYIRYAVGYWNIPKPSYLILVGDATWDYWGRYNNGVKNYVPGYREETEYTVESWFARCDGQNDNIPDMMIGRWPVRSAEGLQIFLQKNITYQQNPPLGSWLNRVFLLTDDDFEMYSDELDREWIPKPFRLTRRHIRDYPLVDNIYLPERLRASMRAKTSLEATADVIEIVNQGQFLWEYFGHGAPNVMGEERMFFGGGSKYSEVKKLTNRFKLPILWAFTCETAKFDYPRDKWNISIGEDLLTHPHGGVVALYGATGRGYPRDHLLLARGLHKTAFHYNLNTHGQIILGAVLLGMAENEFFEPMKQFALLGDPVLAFPRFQKLMGNVEKTADGWRYQWEIPQPFQNKTATLWRENRKDVVIEEAVATTGRIARTIHEASVALDHPPELGIDLIAKDPHLTIAHGALVPPVSAPASAFIASSTGKRPDLTFVPGSIAFTPPSPSSGSTVFIDAVIQNIGQASAKDVFIMGYETLEKQSQTPLHAEVGDRGDRIAQIDPKQTKPVHLRWDPTDNAGSHDILLKIDPNNMIAEGDESNNHIEGTIAVRKKADLVVNASKVELIPAGNQMELQFEIQNQGESKAEKITIQLAVKLNGSNKEHKIFLPKMISLAPGETYSAGGIKIPASAQRLKIIIDPDEIVDEESHDNNFYEYSPPPKPSG